MLDPELITDTLVSTLQDIPDLVALLGGDSTRITGFKFQLGTEVPLASIVYEMASPGILVVWKSTAGGNFDGSTIFKHIMEIYFKGGKLSDTTVVGPGALWHAAMNSRVTSSNGRLRYTRILPSLEIPDTPTITGRQTQDLLDYFCASVTFPELGDDED